MVGWMIVAFAGIWRLAGGGGDVVASRFAVGEEGLDFGVLHCVLDGAEVDVVCEGVADIQGGGVRDHCCEERLVDGLMDVDAFAGDADLVFCR